MFSPSINYYLLIKLHTTVSSSLFDVLIFFYIRLNVLSKAKNFVLCNYRRLFGIWYYVNASSENETSRSIVIDRLLFFFYRRFLRDFGRSIGAQWRLRRAWLTGKARWLCTGIHKLEKKKKTRKIEWNRNNR